MLIDLSIVILVSILYYLLCSISRFINIICGMGLIFLLCWAVGVNVSLATEISEPSFLAVVIVINILIIVNSHRLTQRHTASRMKKFHHHHHNETFVIRGRINNFRLKSINDHFKATPQIYLKTVSNQLAQLNRFVSKHDSTITLSSLIEATAKIPPRVDNINYHLDLSMQINYPRGLKRLVTQYHKIIRQYQHERHAEDQEKTIVDIVSHGNPHNTSVYRHVNLKFPYQRLAHDENHNLIDLLVINHRGVFAFTLLDNVPNEISLNRRDELKNYGQTSINPKATRPTVNLKQQLNSNFSIVNALIPNRINITPRVAVICTNPNARIHLADPHFKILKPQELNLIMNKFPAVLSDTLVNQLVKALQKSFAPERKYQWQVFNTRTQKIITQLIWYQHQLKLLNQKLS